MKGKYYKCENRTFKEDKCPLCENFQAAFGCCSERIKDDKYLMYEKI